MRYVWLEQWIKLKLCDLTGFLCVSLSYDRVWISIYKVTASVWLHVQRRGCEDYSLVIRTGCSVSEEHRMWWGVWQCVVSLQSVFTPHMVSVVQSLSPACCWPYRVFCLPVCTVMTACSVCRQTSHPNSFRVFPAYHDVTIHPISHTAFFHLF